MSKNGCTSVGVFNAANGLMSFELALDSMKRGNKARRSIWPKDEWVRLDLVEGDFLSETGAYHFLSTDDILSTEWLDVLT